MSNTPVPGWYPDAKDPNLVRWWDGQAWTPATLPRRPPAVAPQPPAAPSPRVSQAAPAPAVGLASTDPAGGRKSEKPWYLRWWAIGIGVFLVLAIIGSFIPDEEAAPKASQDTVAPSPKSEEPVEEVAEAEAEPVDTDGDGVFDDEDYRPDDPNVKTEDDVDTDGDGVPDHRDDFPKNAKYTKDSDGDGVADQADAFPKNPDFTKDSDKDGYADEIDDFPNDATRHEITSGMQRAIDKAEDYLDYTYFSRTGLIDQLEFEGFSTGDATFAVDHLKVDWNAQAVGKAEEYLDYTSFSLSGLIDQLVFEGFTYEQASFGAKKVY